MSGTLHTLIDLRRGGVCHDSASSMGTSGRGSICGHFIGYSGIVHRS